MSAAPATRQKLSMKVPEVAELFDVDPETVRVWFREGKLKGRRNPGGRTLVFNRAYVEAIHAAEPDFAAQNTNEPVRCATTERAL
ncbi:helix-turn-helix domain-containing protein [Streptosporangium sp. V21-05]|uniref:helix-turn-helix domain-containing protein n=1 Tax=Streptosporangium sp. V21-05 TaxID=3446115 RepID=UPI003F53CDFD